MTKEPKLTVAEGEAKAIVEVKPKKHRHDWWYSKTINADSYIQRCDCTAKRIVTRLPGNKTEYRYPGGRVIRV